MSSQGDIPVGPFLFRADGSIADLGGALTLPLEANIGEIRLEDHLLRKNPKGFYVLTLPDGTSTDRLFKNGKWAKRPSTEASLLFETKARPKRRRRFATAGALAAVAATVVVGVWYMLDPAAFERLWGGQAQVQVAKNESQSTNGPVPPVITEQTKTDTNQQDESSQTQEEVAAQTDTPAPTIKLTQRDEQTLIHLHKSVSQLLQHHRNTVGAFTFIIGKIKAMEPEFVRGVGENNAFASPQLRDKWRRICQQTLTLAEIASIVELAPLDKQIALGESVPKADLEAFRNRLWIQGKALVDTIKQDQDIRSFISALPRDYRTNNFEVDASPEEVTIARSTELSLACLTTCFDRQSDMYAKTFTIQDFAHNAVKQVDCESMGMLFYQNGGLGCSFTCAGLNISTVVQDYKTARQTVMAMLGTTQPPKQPLEAIFKTSSTAPWLVVQGQGKEPGKGPGRPLFSPSSTENRLWVNTRGQKAMGRLVQIDGERVLLAYPAGKQEWININTLGPHSREYIDSVTGQRGGKYTGCPYCGAVNLVCILQGGPMNEIWRCETCRTTLDSRKDGVYEYFDREYLKRILQNRHRMR